MSSLPAKTTCTQFLCPQHKMMSVDLKRIREQTIKLFKGGFKATFCHFIATLKRTENKAPGPIEIIFAKYDKGLNQAMMNLVWRPFTIGPLAIDALTGKLKENLRLGPVVSLRENGETGEAHFSKAVCLQATDYIITGILITAEMHNIYERPWEAPQESKTIKSLIHDIYLLFSHTLSLEMPLTF
ncbi:hypothetical protein MJT46_001327 [Ovis ammon polii x Ovis aries]|nr:hypothetical protein MJT46_001327 [Ovis ammon polii x Ovis aries]